MILINDEYSDTWVWVETNNHDVELSPQFDDEEAAMLWRSRMINILCKGKE